MTFRNRCIISGANGLINLTVPIEGGRNQHTPMRDLKISNKENWQANHWKSIMSAYNKSPWFDHYRDDLEQLYKNRYELLWDWNMECFRWICDRMAIKLEVELADRYVAKYDVGEFEDWRNRLRPATINKEFPNPPKYHQVFSDRFGFIPNLSILDYLFCAGPRLR